MFGGVSQNKTPNELLLFTPGINLAEAGDDKGQQYNTPEYAFEQLETDFIIVGRGIYKSQDAEKAALTYKIAGWNAYEASL